MDGVFTIKTQNGYKKVCEGNALIFKQGKKEYLGTIVDINGSNTMTIYIVQYRDPDSDDDEFIDINSHESENIVVDAGQSIDSIIHPIIKNPIKIIPYSDFVKF
ncbi:MAG: hypothetical protein IJI84_04200 [Clostridia bacterium]|nr:hypothetical protein [Clostridia bacterium]